MPGTRKPKNWSRWNKPIIITNEQLRFQVAEECRSMGISALKIILEPQAKNTNAAILAAALYIKELDEQALILVLPQTTSYLKLITSNL